MSFDPKAMPEAVARRALALLDLTSLKSDDSDASIDALAAAAAASAVAPAALCVHPAFLGAARRGLEARGVTGVRLATVVNFPGGDEAPERVAAATAAALVAGADEIDVVIPWRALQAGQLGAVRQLLAAVRGACDGADHPVPMKAILETGELSSAALIARAAELAITAGADFLKTSTGKARVQATPAAVAVLLDAIVADGGRVGLKVSGGVASLDDAARYLAQAAAALGDDWITPARFRFGASGLLTALRAVLSPGTASGLAPAAMPPSAGAY